MGKYNLNNTAGKPDPYLEIGTRLNADNTLGTTTKFSAPLLEGRVGRYDRSSGLGLRGVTEALYNKDMSTYNMSAGLEGYLNKNIGNSDGSFQSSLGAGYGTGTQGSAAGGGDGKMSPYLQGNAALMYNNLNKTVRFGPQASYGTTSAPQPGLRVGFGMQKDGLGRGKILRNLGLEGDVSYDFKTGMPTAGVKLNFEDGGPRQYGDGGMDLSMRKTNSFNCGPGVTQCGDTESPLTLQNDLGFNYNTGSSTASAQLGAGLQASLGRGDTRSGAPIISAGARGSAGIGGLTGNDIKFQKNLDAYAKLGFKRKNLSGAHDWSRGRAGFEAGAYGNYDIMNKNLKDVGVYGSYGALTGNVGYDMQNKGIKAGVGFNFEDGGVKEYGEGGKISSLLFKGIKAIPRVAGALGRGAKALSLPSMMLGAGNLGENSTVVDPETGLNRFTGQQSNNMFNSSSGNNTPLPQFNNTEMANINNSLQSAMAPKIMQDGGVSLPGGTMSPIPGSDAVEFNGQSHDQGGIMVDENTEVEGGETMDKVVMSKGGAKDYFFSDHLKKGGMSYAQQHKNILQNGGGQDQINMLAKMQEKAANRDPKQVAKLGGVMKYEEGGPFNSKKRRENLLKDIINSPEYKAGDRSYLEQMNELLVASGQEPLVDAKQQRKEDRRPPIVEQKRRKLRNLQLFVDQGRTLTAEQQKEYDILANDKYLNDGPLAIKPIEMQQIPNEMSEPELAQSNDINKGIPKFIPAGPGRMDYIQNPDYFEPAEPSALNDAGVVGMSQEEVDLAKGVDNTYDAYLARTQMKGTDTAISEEDWNKKQKKEAARIARIMNPGMPTEAKIGAAAQFLPAIGAMLTKQKDPEQYKYTSGFENPIIAERVKGQVYKAPNQDEARARLASSYTGEQRFIDTSGAGAAGIANRQSLFAKKLAAEGTLGAQESKDQITAENLTRKSQEQADARNAQNALAASTTNAQMIQREADRKAAVDNANIGLKNARENEKVANRMNILTNLSQGVAGVMGDTMQYKADERVAKAQGLYGIYERDRLTKALAGQINPVTGKIFTQQEIALKASGLG